ncbi:hypothetical protein T484DRAFT_1936425 [Baffinella frigidus]|nr:hypothetical protein T484DRAFT_1936425 [Cryptophyta sp. CCMP2293]|eukprot:CAMPEP_0180161024 /NCGR_PEP_ID=MMETSP0986-20121125/28437_1 /TAXON_ID=697907 /ORGANISM="non described non described, Strain CCMP2293" /LENGTH=201 /DNA_ID=CAMNT_0022111349 /DNA_START=92 /DNA_END=697 /DNA_ORIENTATION=+
MAAHPTSPSSLLAAFHTLCCDAQVQATAAVDSSLSCIRDLASCQAPPVAPDAAPFAPAPRVKTGVRPLAVRSLARSASVPTPATPKTAAFVRSSSHKSDRHRPPALQLESLATKKQKTIAVSAADTPKTSQVKRLISNEVYLAAYLPDVKPKDQPKKPKDVDQRKQRPTGCSARFRVVHPTSPTGRRAAGGRRTPRHGSAL